ncbi:hypothetical protein CISG_03959 [Coccidioides immitis RMSCC 3703]|uniref:Uncharacterized protein n=2 Tax=Coccidioides immitis TaxID=5501 RepID=A0A0J8QNY4_COCIT|nr:hypothetical protein CIRG_03135 [Coccidioides immitis RMSCC 2394]KMU73980.1 hypothetical protein CISG_03959 [Coccidioides immitis RMSCC 3703]
MSKAALEWIGNVYYLELQSWDVDRREKYWRFAILRSRQLESAQNPPWNGTIAQIQAALRAIGLCRRGYCLLMRVEAGDVDTKPQKSWFALEFAQILIDNDDALSINAPLSIFAPRYDALHTRKFYTTRHQQNVSVHLHPFGQHPAHLPPLPTSQSYDPEYAKSTIALW